ncbi:hypothetical protein JQ557_22470 [Bradyrhizobium sp. U87765 SZCCT0131]|uniref:hypothetical protein n=1 Tax=unclassified Bradyrhizobium TaxID=2631580 RepID=UPI001BA4E047|nr:MULTISPECIES: hypothetical protein [unclassified Bradyrhizobium]MBR1220783.1 hypothetical protein [Bradyrhizobium sp. U87765 SZCCT0131]MBR1260397.1 hypothetical protein [Bradyrhizobium sp. U87765 SZCCT0134]MBR1307354.1 hypothetical protein [Bradyrhizobium sp. U87765 SZCCT0110]MBR1321308.1 hypothetical protein [Bradyrhizobium sp. U87765 SZCCT0109]MBR1349621.1 hypothetical protein [Bradyrhizobium sp. U87765 SZCCT0048]
MRATGFPLLLLLATTVGATPVLAQAKKDAKAPPAAGNEVRYFTSVGGIMDDQADTILKETRSGGKVTGAVLDVCFPAIGNADRKDRFIATLTVDGAKLTGTTQTNEGKQPVMINLTRKASSGGVSFDGKVTIGNTTSNISSADNSDISEKEFKEGQDADDQIIAAPSDYTTASPEAVAVRIKPEGVADFVNTLRGQNLEVSLSSLLPSCTELRKGEQVLHFNIDPERAAEFVAGMKTNPSVITAGWTSGKLDMERTVRFAATDWRDGGRLSRERLAQTLSAAIAKALSATALPPVWNDSNGELKLAFKRPNAALPGLGLVQTITFSTMVAADKPGGSDKLLLWVGYPTIATTDESAGQKLKLADAADSGGEESMPVDEGDTLSAVARELKAQRWDSENSAWK